MLLGIDIGTSACKLAIFDHKGNVVAQETEPYPIYYPEIGSVKIVSQIGLQSVAGRS